MQRSCKQSGDEMRKRIKTIIYALWLLMACCVVTACGGDDGINEGEKQQVEDQDEDDTKATRVPTPLRNRFRRRGFSNCSPM